MTDVDYKKIPIAELEAEIERHNRLYFVENSPQISDYEFDRMVEALRRRKPDSKVLHDIISDISSSAKKVRHDRPMLSLDKCYDDKGALDWAAKFEGGIVASPKIDGCAVSLKYDANGKLFQGATRGDGVEGEEITNNVKFISSIPQKISFGKVEVRGEIYMPLSVFAGFKDTFSNPRNLAAGAIKQKDPKRTGAYNLSFFAYDMIGSDDEFENEKYKRLKTLGFDVVEWKKIGRNEISDVYKYFLSRRDSYDFELDGVVFRVDDLSEQERLGITAHHPRYVIAYKFQGDSGTTRLIDVEWSVSRTGVITPVAIVEPVELSGAKVRRASLHNVGIMKELGLSKGAKVVMMRRGGVIPNLESVAEPGSDRIEIPDRCPSCDSPVEMHDDFLYCTDPDNCVSRKVGELYHFVKAAGIDGFGEKLLERLYHEGLVTDPSELYELSKEDLLGLERMGDTLADKLIRNIDASRNILLADFLKSLGIRELGKHAAKILAQFGSVEKIRKLSEAELSDIHTIGPVIAREVVSGLREKSALIDRLLSHLKVEKASDSGPAYGWGYASKNFLFTGKMLSMGRDEAAKRVEELGGNIASGVSKNLDYLVVGDGGGAGSKLAKAQKIAADGEGLKIISEKEFLEMIS
ncbi:MAG TPA: NAD-dependent DNA ligase LigA [bacterium]|nr:NAD-dependent DNA ligase LigA [Myxococcales bacterium]OQA62254.1 MAG: DNA ligase [bacterium ADurb.Bin270]HPW45151.1 NAD-dependent DNA ligase LigA [bacterium]HQG13485.1 NAD-dependent DNA ligase LigA [bacterium]